jgi:integrase
MSEKKDTTHILVPRKLVLFQRPRSEVWQCRFQMDGKWQRASTNSYDFEEAKEKAFDLIQEAGFRKRMNFVPITRKFKNVAEFTIKKLDEAKNTPDYKPIFEEYKVLINKYLIPFFGKYKIDSINYPVIEEFKKWRKVKMGSEPSRSTELNHNAALNKIFDYAEANGYIHAVNRPTLTTVGRISERRPDFSVAETINLKANFDNWIEQTKEDSKPIRRLLRDYVYVLLDTGARAGKELLTLKWVNLTLDFKPDLYKTGKTVVDEHGQAEEEIVFKPKHAVFIDITQSKTKRRKAVGRLATWQVFNDIAQRNYGKKLEELIKEGCTDEIFMYKEIIGRRILKEKPNAESKLVHPTSFPKLFEKYLIEHNLLLDPITNKPRVLYSLRHTYATIALQHDKIPLAALTRQMGTSVKMMELHYSHLDAVRAVEQLRGEESQALLRDHSQVDKRYAYDPESKIGRRDLKKVTRG